MPQFLIQLYFLLRAAKGLSMAFVQAAWYFRRSALADLQLPASKQLNSRELRRWQHYFYGTTYLGAVFRLLRSQTGTRTERRLFNQLAALSCFFDDLVDEFRDKTDSSVLWEDNPEQYGRATDASGIALHFLQTLYRAMPAANLEEFRGYIHRIFKVELAGRQTGSVISQPEPLTRVAAEKGGYSVLAFRRLLAAPLGDAEKRALFEFGALVQNSDDLFDLWFDRQNRVDTPATDWAGKNALNLLGDAFERQVRNTQDAFRQTTFPRQRVESALAAIHFLVAITRVCLRHYQALQKKHGTLPLENRAMMVVDMERRANRLRAARELLFNRPFS